MSAFTSCVPDAIEEDYAGLDSGMPLRRRDCRPGQTRTCGSAVGECEPGTQTCQAGSWSACSGGVLPVAETCNRLDDDCDGVIDEGGNPCGGVCPLALLGAACDGSDTDFCGDDAYVCGGSNTTICSAGPSNEETCDSVDNDCDGLTDEGCIASGWTPTAPVEGETGRDSHAAVWTGTEMIIWGGNENIAPLGTGRRYDPNSDAWAPTSTVGAPSARNWPVAVWTGDEMIVWGGSPSTNTGGRYDPLTDTWTPTSMAGAPPPRYGHSAVWTGSEMVVWGGRLSGGYLADGGKYDPATDTWTPTSMVGIPGGRLAHTAVWTGSEMIVWGGMCCSIGGYATYDGGRYDPSSDTWSPMASGVARYGHTAAWSGSEMIVFGGRDSAMTASAGGGKYDPIDDVWTAMSVASMPSGRYWHSMVWTGSQMIVWGGYSGSTANNSGGIYSPLEDTWTPLPSAGAPSPRYRHSAVWTGENMIVWGGWAGSLFADGGHFTP